MAQRSLTSGLSVAASLPRRGGGHGETVKVGFLAPLSGEVEAWGLPGLRGCEIWADWSNADGGLRLGGRRVKVEILAVDCRYDARHALTAATRLVESDGIKLLMMLGGDSFPLVEPLVRRTRTLTSTLLPSDLSPDTDVVIAPSEIHPIYNVTGVEWLAADAPQLRRVALCGPRDALGLPSIATYRAAFEAAGIDIVREIFFTVGQADPEAIVASMIASGAEILCWSTSYEPFVHAFTEAAYRQGFQGRLISCTCDAYPRLVARTSPAFMEGFVFQFPDFDDPALVARAINFPRPRQFYEAYTARYPGTWTAVSWEYASVLDLWRAAVESAETFDTGAVLAAMKSGGKGRHAFGDAEWWGSELFGIDNALVGDWPVVVIRGGIARIAEFRSIPAWWQRHGELLKRQMRALGQLWDQRVSPGSGGGTRLPGPSFPRRLAPTHTA